jgi:hypothetical protein
VDLLGRNPCALRQRANFVGDHGKASPLLARTNPSPSRFDGGVERQQIDLLGNPIAPPVSG